MQVLARKAKAHSGRVGAAYLGIFALLTSHQSPGHGPTGYRDCMFMHRSHFGEHAHLPLRARSVGLFCGGYGWELPGGVVGVVDASASRACSCVRICSGVQARRRRSSRAITTPVAATPAKPASPSIFHQRICLGYDSAWHAYRPGGGPRADPHG